MKNDRQRFYSFRLTGFSNARIMSSDETLSDFKIRFSKTLIRNKNFDTLVSKRGTRAVQKFFLKIG